MRHWLPAGEYNVLESFPPLKYLNFEILRENITGNFTFFYQISVSVLMTT